MITESIFLSFGKKIKLPELAQKTRRRIAPQVLKGNTIATNALPPTFRIRVKKKRSSVVLPGVKKRSKTISIPKPFKMHAEKEEKEEKVEKEEKDEKDAPDALSPWETRYEEFQ